MGTACIWRTVTRSDKLSEVGCAHRTDANQIELILRQLQLIIDEVIHLRKSHAPADFPGSELLRC